MILDDHPPQRLFAFDMLALKCTQIEVGFNYKKFFMDQRDDVLVFCGNFDSIVRIPLRFDLKT